MRFLKFLAAALVVALGFSSCNPKDKHDHSADIVGTWTCLTENYAEALIINADGTAVSYGVENGEYWENVSGTVVTEGDNITMTFEDNDNLTGHFDIIPGQAFSLFEDSGERYTYQYCENDLADEIVGMWVCNDGPQNIEDEIIIRTYNNDGKVTTTGIYTEGDNANPILDSEANCKVIGDLVFKEFPKNIADIIGVTHNAERLIYTPNATALGDFMTFFFYLPVGDSYVESHSSYLRIKQHLELPGQKYDYIKTFVTNVKGLDKDIDVMGYTFNFAKMDGVILDKMLKTVLFAVEFPSADTIRYSCHYNEFDMEMDAPIAVDGNKMTVKMSLRNAAYKDVDLYTFQDQDNTQMHMYMHSTAFINFFGNMQVAFMSELGQLDMNDAAAVNTEIEEHLKKQQTAGVSAGKTGGDDAGNGNDPLFVEAGKFIIEKEKASIGMLQRWFKIGFNRAARIMDQLAEAGVVGEEQGTKPREILMSQEQFEQYIEEYL